jgi:hypothetical protein
LYAHRPELAWLTDVGAEDFFVFFLEQADLFRERSADFLAKLSVDGAMLGVSASADLGGLAASAAAFASSYARSFSL